MTGNRQVEESFIIPLPLSRPAYSLYSFFSISISPNYRIIHLVLYDYYNHITHDNTSMKHRILSFTAVAGSMAFVISAVVQAPGQPSEQGVLGGFKIIGESPVSAEGVSRLHHTSPLN